MQKKSGFPFFNDWVAAINTDQIARGQQILEKARQTVPGASRITENLIRQHVCIVQLLSYLQSGNIAEAEAFLDDVSPSVHAHLREKIDEARAKICKAAPLPPKEPIVEPVTPVCAPSAEEPSPAHISTNAAQETKTDLELLPTPTPASPEDPPASSPPCKAGDPKIPRQPKPPKPTLPPREKKPKWKAPLVENPKRISRKIAPVVPVEHIDRSSQWNSMLPHVEAVIARMNSSGNRKTVLTALLAAGSKGVSRASLLELLHIEEGSNARNALINTVNDVNALLEREKPQMASIVNMGNNGYRLLPSVENLPESLQQIRRTLVRTQLLVFNSLCAHLGKVATYESVARDALNVFPLTPESKTVIIQAVFRMQAKIQGVLKLLPIEGVGYHVTYTGENIPGGA